ncbi:MAG TPA: hypothetical protein VGK67_30775 [Myxococcales bacterium]|jgi:hypothetical protein
MKIPRGVSRRVKIYGGTLLVLVALKAAWFFAFRTDGARLIAGEERADLMARRAYLVHRLLQEKTDARGMRTPGGIFTGEWFVGSLSMTAAACTNLAFEYPETRAAAIGEIDQLIVRALEPAAREFDRGMWKGEDALDSLDGPNGHIGYLGHVALMMAERRLLAGAAAEDPYKDAGSRVVEALARRMAASSSSYLETYPGEVYAMDNAAVAAALALHDLGTGQQDHRPVVDRWLAYTRTNLLDPETGLVSFSLGRDGKPNQRSRGSGVGWNSFFLPMVDRAFAAEQFDRLRKHLVDRPLGIAGVREVRRGVRVGGDVDSGPVLLGLSPSGTGFALAGARHASDARLLGEFLDTAELAGFTWQWNGERRYLLAPFVGDAIVLAMKTARPWDRRFLDAPKVP